jgi:hypothetical protein
MGYSAYDPWRFESYIKGARALKGLTKEIRAVGSEVIATVLDAEVSVIERELGEL